MLSFSFPKKEQLLFTNRKPLKSRHKNNDFGGFKKTYLTFSLEVSVISIFSNEAGFEKKCIFVV
jgi:hypothetical protein